MLDLAGLPVWQRDRRETDPIVLGGGPCTANPEPIADFFDAFLVGDAEEALPRLPRRVPRGARARPLRGATSSRASPPSTASTSRPSTTSSYAEDGRIAAITRNDPRAPERARAHLGPGPQARVLPGQADGPVGRDRPGPPRPRGHARLHAGLPLLPGRATGTGPVRELDPGDVADMTKKFIAESGWSEVGLLSLSTADYSQIEPLVAVPRAAALRPARVDLAPVAARRGVLGRPRRRRLGGAQVRLHVRAGDRAPTACAASSTRPSPTPT